MLLELIGDTKTIVIEAVTFKTVVNMIAIKKKQPLSSESCV